jgi:hypothetical protein
MSFSTSIAIGSSVIAGIALLTAGTVALKLRKIRADQRVLLGDGNQADLVSVAASLDRRISAEASKLAEYSEAASLRFVAAEERLSKSVSGVSLMRYDAFDEGSGQQSFSLAIVDETGTGAVVSSLVRRETARVYAQTVNRGKAERSLSPEEQEVLRLAIAEAGEL